MKLKTTKKLTFTLLTTLLILSSFSSQNFLKKSTKNFSRILSAFGGYTVNPDLGSACDSVNEGKVEDQAADYKEKVDKVKDKFSGLNQGVRDFITTQDTAALQKEATSYVWILFGGVVAVFSLISLVILLIYFFFKCLCCCCPSSKGKKAKNKKQVDKLASEKCGKCLCLSSFIVSGLLVGLGFFWMIFFFSAANGAKKTVCGANKAIRMITDGYEGPQNDSSGPAKITFPGIKGIQFLLDKIDNELGGLTSVTTTDLKDSDFNNAKTTMTGYLTTADSNIKAGTSTFTQCSGSGNVTPDSVSQLDGNINEALKKEFELIGDLAEKLPPIGTHIDTVKGDVSGYQTKIQGFSTTLDGTLTSLEDFLSTINDDIDVPKYVKMIKTYGWIVAILIAGVLGLFFLISICQIKGKCNAIFSPITIVLSLVFELLGLVTSIFGVVTIVIQIVILVLCSAMDDYTAGTWDPQGFIPADVQDIMNECIKDGGSGSLTFLDTGSMDFDGLSGVTDGFNIDMAEEFGIDISTWAHPTTLLEFETEINNRLTHTKSDFASVSNENPANFLSAINDNMGQPCDLADNFVLPVSGCSGATTTATSSQTATDPAGAACWPYEAILQVQDMSVRNTNCPTAVKDNYANLGTCLSEYDTLMAKFTTEIGTMKTQTGSLITKLKAANTQIEALKTNLSDTAAFITGLKDNLDTALNCRVAKVAFDTVMSNVCGPLGNNLLIQSGLLSAISFFMFLSGWCAACINCQSTAMKIKKDAEKRLKKKSKYRQSGLDQNRQQQD